MKTITLVGRGLDPSKHLNLENIQALQAADAIFGIEPEMGAWSEIVKTYGLVDIHQIGHLYVDGDKDGNNYSRFVDFIKSSSDLFKNVAFLIAGHPRVGVTFAQTIEKVMINHNPEVLVKFIPNISSFDMMINDIGLDPIEQGTVLLDANRLLLFNMPMDPVFNYFIYHVCSVGTSKTTYSNPDSVNNTSILQLYLAKFYSPEKILKLCKASNGKDDTTKYTSIKLSELGTSAKEIDFSTTLFIPSERPKSINIDFLKNILV